MTKTPTHTKDSDCTVDPTTLCCSLCGVSHSDPCGHCKGAGFHKEDCPFSDANADNLELRSKAAVDEAEQAFWEVIARFFPEAESGDLSPDAVFRFSEACTDAVEQWIDSNHPKRLADRTASERRHERKHDKGWNKTRTEYALGTGEDYYNEVQILSARTRARLRDRKQLPTLTDDQRKARYSVVVFNEDTLCRTKDEAIDWVRRKSGDDANVTLRFKKERR